MKKMSYNSSNIGGKERNSGIELLKIIAIILILISHSTPDYAYQSSSMYVNLQYAQNSIQGLILIIFGIFGQIGNCIFIICSSYFLYESKNINLKKIITIVFETLFVSYIFLTITLLLGINVERTVLLKHCLPIILQNNWFVSGYLMLYMFHPLLNSAINNCDTKYLRKVSVN